jgi:hypothetical protein
MTKHEHQFGCGCDGGCDRRDFLATAGTAMGGMAFTSLTAASAADDSDSHAPRQPATVRVAFLYPPSTVFADNPDGWWSWPGNDFDAEGRQRQYTKALRTMEKSLGLKLIIDAQPVSSQQDAQRLAQEIKAEQPDGLLLVMFYNRSLGQADLLLKAAEELGTPAVFYIGLGVKHGAVAHYRRPGVYFIQSLDNMDAIEYGLRMIGARKRMAQSTLLSITEAKEPREGVEPFFGTTVRVIPFACYADLFAAVRVDDAARGLIRQWTSGASEVRDMAPEALENAVRAHLALKQLLADENADGLTMNCLRRGMLKPCMSFATLNSQLIPAACENDFGAVYTQLLGQLLTGRPGFQHNPCYETERNHYYASHCTCPIKLHGPDGPQADYLLRRFAHTNEGSCAIQVFWQEDDPVTMVRYHRGSPPTLDIYAGRVVKSHPMPPAAGCTTNVEIAITDREDACQVQGHHNLLFCGDFARRFRLFAQLFKMKVRAT